MQVELLNRRRWKTRIETRQRDLRVPRDLAQPTLLVQGPGMEVADRVREPEQDRLEQ
jgi:hypothetical protein